MHFLTERTSLALSFLTVHIGFSSTKADYSTLCKKAIYIDRPGQLGDYIYTKLTVGNYSRGKIGHYKRL